MWVWAVNSSMQSSEAMGHLNKILISCKSSFCKSPSFCFSFCFAWLACKSSPNSFPSRYCDCGCCCCCDCCYCRYLLQCCTSLKTFFWVLFRVLTFRMEIKNFLSSGGFRAVRFPIDGVRKAKKKKKEKVEKLVKVSNSINFRFKRVNTSWFARSFIHSSW